MPTVANFADIINIAAMFKNTILKTPKMSILIKLRL